MIDYFIQCSHADLSALARFVIYYVVYDVMRVRDCLITRFVGKNVSLDIKTKFVLYFLHYRLAAVYANNRFESLCGMFDKSK